MKILIILLTILNISAVYANENILFMTIPSNATVDDAIGSINAAAIKRGWTVHEIEDNKIRIELDHHRYKAVLEFYFSEDEIHYSDFTTRENPAGVVETEPAPTSWINNLKHDVSIFLALNRKCEPVKELFSHEYMVEKLESLKALYDKKLITETQYRLKQEEIMSRY